MGSEIARVNTIQHLWCRVLAGRIAVKEAGTIRYLLTSLRIPVVGSTPIYVNCMRMIQSCSIPEGVLKKKHKAISYHTVQEMVASGAVVPYKVDTKDNLADLLTKALSATVLLPLSKRIWPKHHLSTSSKG